MFTIATEPARKLVRLKISGLLSVADVEEFYRQQRAAIQAMGCRLGDHLVLADLCDCPLQFQEVVAAFQKEMRAPTGSRRLAMATGNSLARMQARRLAARDNAALFVTPAEAETWLFAADRADQAA